MHMAALLNEHELQYGLDAVGKRTLGKSKNEKELRARATAYGIDPKKDLWRLPASMVGGYAEEDASLCIELYYSFIKDIERLGLSNIYELESDVLQVVVDMRMLGVPWDQDASEELERDMESELAVEMAKLKDHCGFEPDIWKPDSLARAFDKLGINYNKTATGRPSITAVWMDHHPSEFAKLVRKARVIDKARRDYVIGWRRYVHNGRVHPSWNQLRGDNGDDSGTKGAVTGRFSCDNPPLQQASYRKLETRRIRRQLRSDPGTVWAQPDYSQQEPRLMVHVASLLGIREAEAAVDFYRNKPDADFHQFMSDLTGLVRLLAKNIFLGKCYGMGRDKFLRETGLPAEEFDRCEKQFNEKAAFVVKASRRCMNLVEARIKYPFDPSRPLHPEEMPYIKTIMGRRSRFNTFDHRDRKIGFGRQWRTINAAIADLETQGISTSPEDFKIAMIYKALNKTIQGSAADQTKKALVEVWRAGFTPYIQMHDELDLPLPSADGPEARQVKEIMENCITLKVPSKVDIAFGYNWCDLKDAA